MYGHDTIQSTVWTAAKDHRAFELHWQKLGKVFLGAVYHPPRPLYTSESILKYIEEALVTLNLFIQVDSVLPSFRYS